MKNKELLLATGGAEAVYKLTVGTFTGSSNIVGYGFENNASFSMQYGAISPSTLEGEPINAFAVIYYPGHDVGRQYWPEIYGNLPEGSMLGDAFIAGTGLQITFPETGKVFSLYKTPEGDAKTINPAYSWTNSDTDGKAVHTYLKSVAGKTIPVKIEIV